MPYRLDARLASATAFDRLVELGALDADLSPSGSVAAIMPDTVSIDDVARALRTDALTVSPAVGRDNDSVWWLTPRPMTIGRLRIVPAHVTPSSDAHAITLLDSPAFGTGLHPTTALCIEAMLEEVEGTRPGRVLDVGTGSGILALAALRAGVGQAIGLDTDGQALQAATANARANAMEGRLHLLQGGPDAVRRRWPLVLANILASPLIEMAPALVRTVGRHGRLVLSGIPASVQPDVERVYRRLGMRRLAASSRDGWVALVFAATW